MATAIHEFVHDRLRQIRRRLNDQLVVFQGQHGSVDLFEPLRAPASDVAHLPAGCRAHVGGHHRFALDHVGAEPENFASCSFQSIVTLQQLQSHAVIDGEPHRQPALHQFRLGFAHAADESVESRLNVVCATNLHGLRAVAEEQVALRSVLASRHHTDHDVGYVLLELIGHQSILVEQVNQSPYGVRRQSTRAEFSDQSERTARAVQHIALQQAVATMHQDIVADISPCILYEVERVVQNLPRDLHELVEPTENWKVLHRHQHGGVSAHHIESTAQPAPFY